MKFDVEGYTALIVTLKNEHVDFIQSSSDNVMVKYFLIQDGTVRSVGHRKSADNTGKRAIHKMAQHTLPLQI